MWAFILFLYLLGILLSLHLVYIAVFGVSFLYSGSLWGSLYYGVFFAVGGVVSVACQGILVRELVSVFGWVELNFFSLEFNEVSSNEL